jgi:hypothetical protein
MYFGKSADWADKIRASWNFHRVATKNIAAFRETIRA